MLLQAYGVECNWTVSIQDRKEVREAPVSPVIPVELLPIFIHSYI